MAMVYSTKPEIKEVAFKVQDPRFSLPITMTVYAVVHEMSHEDGSGESWNLILTVNGERCRAYYNSRIKKDGVRGSGVISVAK
jgi:hypothetical protein